MGSSSSCRIWTLSCGIWDLVPWPGIEPRPPELGVQSLMYWTTREVPQPWLFELQVALAAPRCLYPTLTRVMLGQCPCYVRCAKALQPRPAPCDPMDCDPMGSGSPLHVIFQARILECVATPSSKRSSQLRDQTCIIFFNVFILIGGYLLYNIVVAFAIHWHESAMGIHVSPGPVSPSHLPAHPIPQGCPSTPALSALFHTLNLDWSSISHTVIYMLQCCSLKSSHPCLLPLGPKVSSLHLPPLPTCM